MLAKASLPGWGVVVPFYGMLLILELAGKPSWWAFVFPIIIFVLPFDIARRFGKSMWFGVGLLVLLPIFLPILAFGDSKFNAEL